MSDEDPDKKDWLRRLGEKFDSLNVDFTKGDYDNFLIDIASSERVMALTLPALLENTLTLAIQSRMRPLDDSMTSKLFGTGTSIGVLSAMSAKIDIGFALRIYEKSYRNDLHSIARIRNRFAHQIRTRDFTNPEIAKLCRKLTVPKLFDTARELSKSDNPEPSDSQRFFMTCLWLWMHLLRFITGDAELSDGTDWIRDVLSEAEKIRTRNR